MTLAVWPVSVPFRPASPYVVRGPEGAFQEDRFDKGPAVRRRVTSANLSTVDVTLPALTREEVAVLLQWHDSVLGAGTLAFEMEDPLTGLLRTWAFASPISIEPVAVTWRTATFTLNIYPGST